MESVGRSSARALRRRHVIDDTLAVRVDPEGHKRLVADHPSGGSNTPKGSTPVSGRSRQLDSKASNAANTSKASTPIPHRVAGATTYELDLHAERLSSYIGQTVAITGTTSQSAGASRLTVDSMRVIAPGCSY